MGFAEGDPALYHLSGAGKDEQRLAISLHVGPLMRLQGSLHGKFVQADPDPMPWLVGQSPASSMTMLVTRRPSDGRIHLPLNDDQEFIPLP